MEITKQQVAAAIKEFRRKNNYSQAQLAERLSVSSMQILRWENAKTIPNGLSMKALRELKVI